MLSLMTAVPVQSREQLHMCIVSPHYGSCRALDDRTARAAQACQFRTTVAERPANKYFIVQRKCAPACLLWRFGS